MSDNRTGSVREMVAEEVRVLLARRRLSASELARQIGVTQPYISRRLTGDTPFDVDDLGRIARALDVPITALLPAGDDTSPNVRSLSAARPTERPVGRTQPTLTNPPTTTQLSGRSPQRVAPDVNGRPHRLSIPAPDGAQ